MSRTPTEARIVGVRERMRRLVGLYIFATSLCAIPKRLVLQTTRTRAMPFHLFYLSLHTHASATHPSQSGNACLATFTRLLYPYVISTNQDLGTFACYIGVFLPPINISQTVRMLAVIGLSPRHVDVKRDDRCRLVRTVEPL